MILSVYVTQQSLPSVMLQVMSERLNVSTQFSIVFLYISAHCVYTL